jgi:hypothetical protein
VSEAFAYIYENVGAILAEDIAAAYIYENVTNAPIPKKPQLFAVGRRPR